MIQTYASEIREDLRERDVSHIYERLDDTIRDRIRRRPAERDRVRSLATYDLLLRVVPEESTICSGTYGKPQLVTAGASSGIPISLAHSDGWGVCAVASAGSPFGAVGIDIERIADIPDDSPGRYFHAREREWLSRMPEGVHFYILWTLKESYLKARGTGLLRPLDSFSIDFRREMEPGVHDPIFTRDYVELSFDRRIVPGHVVSLCGIIPE